MTKIAPFKAVVYNQDLIKDLSRVVCPPYDIISPARQKKLMERSPYNLIHMELGEDAKSQDRYERAAAYMAQWLQKQVLVPDSAAALYLYRQEYWIRAEKKIRYGFLALLKLDEQKSSVYGHEHTHLEAKEDRLKLIRQVRANLSPIFVVFEDKKRIMQQTLIPCADKTKPFIDLVDDDKTRHTLWRINAPEIIKKVQDRMQAENIFIADGHHRYEVSLAYRDEMKAKTGTGTGDESFHYVLAYLTHIDSLGLTVLPIHRMVRLKAPLEAESFFAKAKEFFTVEEIKDKARFFFLMAKAGMAEHVIGMYYDQRYWLLRLKNVKVLDRMISNKPVEYRTLDVSILNALILDHILKLDLNDRQQVDFTAETEELLQSVSGDKNRIAFLLNPTKMEQIVSVALKGEKMPPKSTYFYPKVLSGLVVHKHE